MMAKKNDTELLAEDPPHAGEVNSTESSPGLTVTSSSPAAPAELRSPRDWAEKLGFIVRGDARLPQSLTFPKMEHAVADKLHGWSQHEHHFQNEPLKLSRADYEKALEAASNPTTKVILPHEPALSPVSPIARSRKAAEAQKGSV